MSNINNTQLSDISQHKNFKEWVLLCRVMLFQIGAIKNIKQDSDMEVLKQAYFISIGVSKIKASFTEYLMWLLDQDPKVQGVMFSLN